MLDTWEDLTDLGLHAMNLPVDLRYGKMILYSFALKCLDSILTIVCAMSCKSPCNNIEK
jgi:ATP-dependent RNA helicase YTHDC2